MASSGGRGRRRPGERHVALLSRRGRFTVAKPLFEPGEQVALDRKTRIREGQIAWVEFRGGRARLLRELGRVDNARDVCEALALERLRRRGFTGAIEAEAEAAALDPVSSVERRDLTGLATFTVDPATARDFDDAVSAESEGDSVRLWIHIADVAAYVRPGSNLEALAWQRANSVYVPTSVEPMLPEVLSAGVCSLSPGEQRLAVTTEILLSGSGEVVSSSFYRSRIVSDARLDYEQLDRVFAGSERPPQTVAEPIRLARAAASVLAARKDRTRLEVTSSEPGFSFDGDGNVVSATADVQTEAHRLIEHLMVLNNEQVAELLQQRRTPTLYRVHEQPDPDRISRLAEQLASLGLPAPAVVRRHGPGGGRAVRSRSLPVDRGRGRPPRTRGRAFRLAGPQIPEAGPVLGPQPGSRRSRQRGLLPLHFTDPPFPGPARAPRAPLRSRRRRAATGPGRGHRRR